MLPKRTNVYACVYACAFEALFNKSYPNSFTHTIEKCFEIARVNVGVISTDTETLAQTHRSVIILL